MSFSFAPLNKTPFSRLWQRCVVFERIDQPEIHTRLNAVQGSFPCSNILLLRTGFPCRPSCIRVILNLSIDIRPPALGGKLKELSQTDEIVIAYSCLDRHKMSALYTMLSLESGPCPSQSSSWSVRSCEIFSSLDASRA